MQTRFANIRFSGLLALFLTAPTAHAIGFSIYGVGDFARLSDSTVTAPTGMSSKLGMGGGVAVDTMFVPMVGLEIGALLVSREFAANDIFAGVDTFTEKFIQIPVLLKIMLARNISIGAGGYYAFASGNPTGSNSIAGPAPGLTYSTLGQKTSDYGLIGSLGLNMPLGPMTALVFEGRLCMGLADTNEPTDASGTTKFRDVQGLVGLRFGLMK